MVDAIFKITNVKNGLLLDVTTGSGEYKTKEKIVFQEDEYDEKDCWISFLQHLTEEYGPQRNRYGKEEIRIVKKPGSKCDLEDDVAWFLEEVGAKSFDAETVKRLTAIIRGEEQVSYDPNHQIADDSAF